MRKSGIKKKKRKKKEGGSRTIENGSVKFPVFLVISFPRK